MAGEREKFRKMLDAKEREMTEMRDVMQQQLGLAAFIALKCLRSRRGKSRESSFD